VVLLLWDVDEVVCVVWVVVSVGCYVKVVGLGYLFIGVVVIDGVMVCLDVFVCWLEVVD